MPLSLVARFRRDVFPVIVIIAIALIPLIYAGALTSANEDPTHHLDNVPAALVNNDVPATAGETTIDLGAELSDDLLSSTADNNFDWREMSADDAAAALADGEVLAVLTIPASFSADAASPADNDAATARTATLSVETNDGANMIVGNIAASISTQLRHELATSVSAEYLENVYLGFSDIHEQVADAASGAAELTDGAADARDGGADLAAGLDDLAVGSSELSGAARKLAKGASSALSGAQSLETGLDSLAASTPSLATGSAAVRDGIQSVIDGYASMTDDERLAALAAIEQAATAAAAGADTMDHTAAALAAGATQLVGSSSAGTGLDALASGSAALAAGAADASTGAARAAAGAAELEDGLIRLSAGAGELSDGLATGVSDIPDYSTAEAQQLSSVTADPIEVDTTRLNEVPAYGYGLAPYFLALATWVGALAFYLMMPALSPRALDRRRSAIGVALASYLPGAGVAVAQSVLATLVLVAGVGITPASIAGLFGMILLTSLTFFAINQALIALLGPTGRFLALVMVVLQLASAGGTYPIQTAPELFQVIHSWLPLSHALEAFRSLIAGGSIGIAPAVGVLITWLVGALAVTVLASVRARRAGVIGDELPEPEMA